MFRFTLHRSVPRWKWRSVVPVGPRLALHVVGIEAAEFEFTSANNPSYDLYGTEALAREIASKTVGFDAYFVRLRHGAADLLSLSPGPGPSVPSQ